MDNTNIMRSLNSRNKNLQVDVQVITLADNLEHPYFSLIELSKNILSPNGIVVMEAPYTQYISDYWIKYQGEIVISFNMADLKSINTNSQNFYDYVNSTEKAKFFEKQQLQKKIEEKKANKNTESIDEEEYVERQQRLQNDHYNYSFIGKISRFKQKGNKFVIYFEDLGWKFLQKVPKEFRDTFIAGQYLDDAFQAICEFLGVEFAYSIEDLHAYTFSSDGYSVQKDGQTIEDVSTILSEWSQKTSEETEGETDQLDDPINENSELIELDKKNENNENYIKTNNNTVTNNSSNSQTNELNNTTNEITEEAKNNENNAQDKIEKYQDEFDRKILDLFIGNTYYESDLINPILDYNNITITPKVTESNASSSGMGAVSDSTSNTDGSNNGVGYSLDPTNTNIGLQGITMLGTTKTALTYDQVNSMSVTQARAEASKTDKYYWTTILRLRARGAAYQVGPGTPYSKFNY